nr:invasion associated locus B family protein [uncultured Rhodoblastus sp.]
MGCYADVVLNETQLKNFHGQKEDASGVLSFIDGANQDAKFNISLRGLTQGLDALGKEF